MDSRAAAWFGRRTTRWQDFPAAWLLARKAQLGVSVSVVIPARNEERTVAGVVSALWQALIVDVPLVDELVVMDSDSADATAEVAARAGAVVHRAGQVAPGLGACAGKGEALWKSLLVTRGDLLVFVDADLTEWGPHFVTGLLGPLLAEPEVQLVKGFYRRTPASADGADGADNADRHAQSLTQSVSHQGKGVLHPARPPQRGGVQRRPQRPRAEPAGGRGQLHRPLDQPAIQVALDQPRAEPHQRSLGKRRIFRRLDHLIIADPV
jgi:hypothetical protein